MPDFFGNPVLPTYTGITAQDALTDEEKAQQQAFDQQRQHMMDVQQGRDSGVDNPNPIGTAIGRIRSLFGGSNDPNQAGTSAWADRMNAVGDYAARSAAPTLDAAGAGAPSAAVSGTDTLPSSGLMRLRNAPTIGQPSSSDGVSQGVNGAPTPDLWGMNRDDAVNSAVSPYAIPAGNGVKAPKMGAAPDGGPMAGEFVPQMGRFATAQDGQQYTQLAQAAAAGIPPQGLMATRSGQGAGNVTRTPGTPNTPIQPQPGAAAPTAATRAPAPAPTLPAGGAPASAAPQLLNAQAAMQQPPAPAAASGPQLLNAQAAMTPPPSAPPQSALPNLQQFLASQGVEPTVSRPGLGTVSRVLPLVPAELETQGRLAQAQYEQQNNNWRAMLDQVGAASRSQQEQATQRDIATASEASARLIAGGEQGTQRDIADKSLEARLAELRDQAAWREEAFGFKATAQTNAALAAINKPLDPLQTQAGALRQAITALDIARTNPAETDPATLSSYMARAAGGGSAQLRSSMAALAGEGVDPSVPASWSRFFSEKSGGVYPAKQITNIQSALRGELAGVEQNWSRAAVAGANQHTELPDAMGRLAVQHSVYFPEIPNPVFQVQTPAGAAGAIAAGNGTTARTAGPGGVSGDNSATGSPRPVTQSQWNTIVKNHGLSPAQMKQYYTVVGGAQ